MPNRRSRWERMKWLAAAATAVVIAALLWTSLALLALILWLIPQLPR